MRNLLLVVLSILSLATLACAPRCRVRAVPMYWNDGTVSVWHMTVCDRGVTWK